MAAAELKVHKAPFYRGTMEACDDEMRRKMSLAFIYIYYIIYR